MESRSKALRYALTSALAFAVVGVFVKLAADVRVLDKILFRDLVSLIVAFAPTPAAPRTDNMSS